MPTKNEMTTEELRRELDTLTGGKADDVLRLLADWTDSTAREYGRKRIGPDYYETFEFLQGLAAHLRANAEGE